MADKFNNPVFVLNIVELILNIVIAGLVANMPCPAELIPLQFVSAVVYGYLMISLIVVCSQFTESLEKTLRIFIGGVGFILWLAASALILQAADTGICQLGQAYDQSVAAGVLGLANVVALAVDAFFVYKQ